MADNLRAFELVRIIELQEILWADDQEPFRFRIEIFQESGRAVYFSRLLRRETVRVQPTFPQANGVPSGAMADVQVVVPDTYLVSWDETEAVSSDESAAKVVEKINKFFNVSISLTRP